MSEDAKEDIRDFLEELTDIARTGQNIAIPSGFHLVWWGSVVSLACGVNLFARQFDWPMSDIHIWSCAILMGWLGSKGLRKSSAASTRPGAAARPNKSTRYIWFGVGLIASFVTIGEAAHLFDFAGRGYFVAFLLCGFGLFLTALATDEKLLMLSGCGWVVVGLGSLFLPITASLVYQATIVACCIFLIIPGLVLAMRKS